MVQTKKHKTMIALDPSEQIVKWISVKDKLPPKFINAYGLPEDFSQKVLVKTRNNPDYWYLAEYYHDDGTWICLENNTYTMDADNVTHWMQIHV